jgi:translation initiation factor 3 subunit D
MPGFQLLKMPKNGNGWGPQSASLSVEELAHEVLPEELQYVPYATFNKSDKLGRFADWSGQVTSGQRAFGHKNYQGLYNTGSANVMFGFRAGGMTAAPAISSFSPSVEAWSSPMGGVFYDDEMLSTATGSGFQPGLDMVLRPMAGRRMMGAATLRPKMTQKMGSKLIQRTTVGSFSAVAGGAANPPSGGLTPTMATQRQRQMGARRRFDLDTAPKLRDYQVPIRSDWKLVEEFEFSKLNKLTFNVHEPVDL